MTSNLSDKYERLKALGMPDICNLWYDYYEQDGKDRTHFQWALHVTCIEERHAEDLITMAAIRHFDVGTLTFHSNYIGIFLLLEGGGKAFADSPTIIDAILDAMGK